MDNDKTAEYQDLLKTLATEEATQLKELLQVMLLVGSTEDAIQMTITTAGVQLPLVISEVECIQHFCEFLTASIDALKADLQ